MQHLYRTTEDLQAEQPVCADTNPVHPIKPEPVCAYCASVTIHDKQAEINRLQTTIAELEAELLTLREQRKALTDYIAAEDTGALLNEVVVLREQRDKVLALCDQWSDENRDGSFFSQFTRGIVAHVRRALGVTPEADQ